MRVLTIGNLYPPHHFGGYEQVWQSAVGHLRQRGDEVRVLATRHRHPGTADGDEPGVFRQLGWYWADHEFVPLGRREIIALERRNHALLDGHIGELRPDVVSFWSMGGMSHTLIEDVRRRGLPMVAFVHDQWLDYGRHTDQWARVFHRPSRRRLAPAMEWLLGVPASVDYARAGRYVFVSDFIRRRALDLGLGLEDTAVAPSGIHPDFLAPARREPGRGWRILHVGRLHPDKGIEDAVDALARMPEEATLTFAGTWDPREEDTLAAQIDRLGLRDRVTMLGHAPRARVRELYLDHDAVLFPVRWDEPWGLVPLEAMACGCPVVATGRGGSGEYLRDGENCLLVPAEDPAAIAAACARLAADPALVGRLGAAGRATAAEHTEPIFNAAVAGHLDAVA